ELLVIQAADARQYDRFRVEDLLAARDRASRLRIGIAARQLQPRREQRERSLIESCARWIQADRIVDAEEERLRREAVRAARRALRVERAGAGIANLRGKQAGFEGDDLLRLRVRQIAGRRGVSARGVVCLVQQVLC